MAHSCVRTWWRACRGGRAAGSGPPTLTACARAAGRVVVVAPSAAFLATSPLHGARCAALAVIHNGLDLEPAPRPRQGAHRAGRRAALGRGEGRRAPWPRSPRGCPGRCVLAGEVAGRTRGVRTCRSLGRLERDELLTRGMARGRDLRRPGALRAVRACGPRGGACPAARWCSGHPEPGRAVGGCRPLRAAGRRRGAAGALLELIADPTALGRAQAAARQRARHFTPATDGRGVSRPLRRPSRRRPRVAEPRRMRIVLFCHSLASCWNHGNAHFLRGVARELLARGHEVRVFEPADGWSRREPDRRPGRGGARRLAPAPIPSCAVAATTGRCRISTPRWMAPTWCWCTNGTRPSWSPPSAAARAHGRRFTLLFHDTHHRAVTAPEAIGGVDPRRLRRRAGFRRLPARAVPGATAGPAASGPGTRPPTRRVFRPLPGAAPRRDLSGSATGATASATRSCARSCSSPWQALGLRAHGPRRALSRATRWQELAAAGIGYRGWLPNHACPAASPATG